MVREREILGDRLSGLGAVLPAQISMQRARHDHREHPYACRYACRYACTRVCVYVLPCTAMYAMVLASIPAMPVCLYACMHAYTHACMHTYVCSYMCMTHVFAKLYFVLHNYSRTPVLCTYSRKHTDL